MPDDALVAANWRWLKLIQIRCTLERLEECLSVMFSVYLGWILNHTVTYSLRAEVRALMRLIPFPSPTKYSGSR
jgi:hypothetical protein